MVATKTNARLICQSRNRGSEAARTLHDEDRAKACPSLRPAFSNKSRFRGLSRIRRRSSFLLSCCVPPKDMVDHSCERFETIRWKRRETKRKTFGSIVDRSRISANTSSGIEAKHWLIYVGSQRVVTCQARCFVIQRVNDGLKRAAC